MKELLARQRELTARLNVYRDEYYNKNAPSVSDAVYDRLFDELVGLEEQTGVIMTNSPTQTVGYPVVSGLPEAKRDIPLLSLDKTKLVMTLFLTHAPADEQDTISKTELPLSLKMTSLKQGSTILSGRRPVPVRYLPWLFLTR